MSPGEKCGGDGIVKNEGCYKNSIPDDDCVSGLKSELCCLPNQCIVNMDNGGMFGVDDYYCRNLPGVAKVE